MITFDGLRLGAYGLVAVVALGTGWQVRGWKEGSDANRRAEALADQQEFARDLVAGISKETLEAIGNIRIENTTIYQKATHEVQTNTVYRDCRVPAAGMQLVNAARTSSD